MSKGEEDLGVLLREEFPHYRIYPQHPIKATIDGRKVTLYVDYCIPNLRLAFEVDGRQHDEYVRFFHATKQDFERGRNNDANKARWLAQCGYTLVVFKAHEKINLENLRFKIAQTERSTARDKL